MISSDPAREPYQPRTTGGAGSVCCRFCRGTAGEVVLDMGLQPPCDLFPPASDPGADPEFPLWVWFCTACRLAQLAENSTEPEQVRGVEPAALTAQARDAVERVAQAGLLPRSGAVIEHGSPHGGSWLNLFEERGLHARSGADAEVVVDCFGLMHESDLRTALSLRAGETAPNGVLLLQYHSLAAVVENGQWNSFQHGHPVYLSTPTVVNLLDTVWFGAVHAWRFALNGGTVLIAARRGGRPDDSVRDLIATEQSVGVGDPVALRYGLGHAAAEAAGSLRQWLCRARSEGRTVLGYGAAARTVPLLNHAKIGPDLLPAVADASADKHGRRIPGVRIPIVSPGELVARAPDDVLLFVPHLLDEVRGLLTELSIGRTRWIVAEPNPRVVAENS